jgi:hypothetical protein
MTNEVGYIVIAALVVDMVDILVTNFSNCVISMNNRNMEPRGCYSTEPRARPRANLGPQKFASRAPSVP